MVILIAACKAIVTNDSGLMHVVVALNRPLVALFGPSSPDFTPPLPHKVRVIRLTTGCHKVRKGDAAEGYHQSLIDITPQRVLEEPNALLLQEEARRMWALIIKTSSMGDVLHTLPALTDVQQAIPGIKFGWVAEEGFAQIPSWYVAVERVIPVAIRRWRKVWFLAPIEAERKALHEALQAENYDAVIDAQGLVKSVALVTRLAHGVKHGLDWQAICEPLASLFYNRKHHIAKQQHVVERIRELLAKSLGYSKLRARGDYTIVQHFLTNLPTDAGEYAVFLHAMTHDDKHWSEEHWRELIGLLADSGIWIKLPWGAPHEEERVKRLVEGFAYVEVLPKMNLEGVTRVLAGAKFVVSVDTGLSHLTAALDRPNITVYGPTDPELAGGYGKNQMVCRAPGNKLS